MGSHRRHSTWPLKTFGVAASPLDDRSLGRFGLKGPDLCRVCAATQQAAPPWGSAPRLNSPTCAEAFSSRERRLHGFGVVAMEPRRKPRGGKELIPRSLPPSHAFTQSLPRSFITTLPPRLEELDRATSELPESYGVQKFLADQQRAT
jgi:hypothetical protein